MIIGKNVASLVKIREILINIDPKKGGSNLEDTSLCNIRMYWQRSG